MSAVTAVKMLTNPGQWIWIVRFGDRAWVDGEEVSLEVFQHFCSVNMEGESDVPRPVVIRKYQGGH